jgi:hypothetical protein
VTTALLPNRCASKHLHLLGVCFELVKNPPNAEFRVRPRMKPVA